MGIEIFWNKMIKKEIYASFDEWEIARKLIMQKIQQGKKPPFKVPKNSTIGLHHSFLVSLNEIGQPIIGVIARSKVDQSENISEGILGHGSFGVCKLIQWEDGQYNALKVEEEKPGNAEMEIMKNLGIIRIAFTRTFEERINEKEHEGKYPSTRWIQEQTIFSKEYKVMPLVNADELNEYLFSVGELTPRDGYKFIKSIARELKNLHDKDIIHNDLHNGNIMIDINKKAYIVDYGRSFNLRTTPNTISGYDTIIDVIYNKCPRNDISSPEINSLKSFLSDVIEKAAVKGNIRKLRRIFSKNYPFPYSKATDIYSLGVVIEVMCPKILKEDILSPLRKLYESMQNRDPLNRPTIEQVLNILNSKEMKIYIKQLVEFQIQNERLKSNSSATQTNQSTMRYLSPTRNISFMDLIKTQFEENKNDKKNDIESSDKEREEYSIEDSDEETNEESESFIQEYPDIEDTDEETSDVDNLDKIFQDRKKIRF